MLKVQVSFVVVSIKFAIVFNILVFNCLVAELNCTLQNALKLFQEDGIIECYQHSGVKVIYVKDPFNEGPILQLIQDVAQFIS